jgi:PAS domain S-box-containing protein
MPKDQSTMKQEIPADNRSTVVDFPIMRANSAINGMLMLSPDGVVQRMNASAIRLLDAPASLEGEMFEDYLSSRRIKLSSKDEHGLKLPSYLHAVVKGGAPQQLMMMLPGKETSRWLLAELSMLALGDSTAENLLLVSLVDITRFKQQEELTIRQMKEITDQNRQWHIIYDNMQESIVLLDTKGRVLSANPATEKITGYKASETIGRHVGELFPKVDATVPGIDNLGRSGLEQALEDSRPSDLFEAVVATKDGRHIWVTYTYTPLRDPKGEITALARVTSDVSTVKAVDQMKNDFISIASHELRTPLGVITSYLTLFLNGQLGDLTDEQKVYVQRVFNAGSDMSALVEDLLNMSRIESGKAEIAEQPFFMRELVEEVLSQLKQRIHSKKVHIKIDAPQERFMVHADKQKIEQALTNIIDNAIKYTYDNGDIIITLRADKGAVSVSVKDSGVGIKPENLGHIFEKFYRENNPLSIKEGGSGLGLYISRKLVELHGGSISVTSVRKSGSTFTITLPAKANEANNLNKE